MVSDVLKVDLHIHTSDDPMDRIPYSTCQLIERAATLGYDALAITLHDRQLDVRPLADFAAERGLVLIPGIERTVEGRHVLLLNFPSGAVEGVQSFDDVRRLKRQSDGLVIAPHPYFPGPSSLFGALNRHADVFDAVECNAMYTASLDFNRPAERWARAHDKPMVGNGDVHRFEQLGTTYSLVDAERDAAAICAAVASGHVRVVTRPLTWATAARVAAGILASSLVFGARSPEPAGATV
ncbi:MAG TPA: PHP-associated domain-containing protein [Vicinamibacterales bacterium]